MKRLLIGLLIMIGGIGAVWTASEFQSASLRSALQKKESEWQREKLLLESQLIEARLQLTATPKNIPRPEVVEVNRKQTPAEIIGKLKTLRVGAKDTKNIRQAIRELENLIDLGESALPDIQAFLATQTDIDYDPSIFGSWKSYKDGRVPIDFVFPPSLRFGLFDATRKIGGSKAEKLLAETLRVTGRGVELAYLARVLQEMAPFQYRDIALSAAKDLLNNPVNGNSSNALDKFERNYLFGVLAFYKDGSLATQAQEQLVQTDGKIDRGALQYLKETLGQQAVSTIAQLYQDARIIDGKEKEPLARLALNFAGANEQADALYKLAIKDPNLTPDSRRELIEDLNQDGFENLKDLSERDLQLIQNRLALIGQSRNETDPKIIADAFNEAEKDLKQMLAKSAVKSPLP